MRERERERTNIPNSFDREYIPGYLLSRFSFFFFFCFFIFWMVGYVAAIMSNSDRLFSRLVIANSFPGSGSGSGSGSVECFIVMMLK